MKKGVDHIGVTVCFYCHDGNAHHLLQKRSKFCRDEHGSWDCGGGSMRFGESFEDAVQREIQEEYCTTPLQMKFAGVSNVIRGVGKERTHWVAIIFTVLLNPKVVKIGDSEKIDEIGWFNIDKLPRPLHSRYLSHLRYAQKYF